MTHCRPDYEEWEQRNTCIKCAHPLSDNQLVKDAIKVNGTAAWAKGQLTILSEMAEDRQLPTWFIDDLKRIKDGIRLLEA